MDDASVFALLSVLVSGVLCVALISWTMIKLRGVPKNTQQVTDSLEAMEKRFARVEVALDDVTTELNRLSEGQQAVQRLLADRPGVALPRSGS